MPRSPQPPRKAVAEIRASRLPTEGTHVILRLDHVPRDGIARYCSGEVACVELYPLPIRVRPHHRGASDPPQFSPERPTSLRGSLFSRQYTSGPPHNRCVFAAPAKVSRVVLGDLSRVPYAVLIEVTAFAGQPDVASFILAFGLFQRTHARRRRLCRGESPAAASETPLKHVDATGEPTTIKARIAAAKAAKLNGPGAGWQRVMDLLAAEDESLTEDDIAAVAPADLHRVDATFGLSLLGAAVSFAADVSLVRAIGRRVAEAADSSAGANISIIIRALRPAFDKGDKERVDAVLATATKTPALLLLTVEGPVEAGQPTSPKAKDVAAGLDGGDGLVRTLIHSAISSRHSNTMVPHLLQRWLNVESCTTSTVVRHYAAFAAYGFGLSNEASRSTWLGHFATADAHPQWSTLRLLHHHITDADGAVFDALADIAPPQLLDVVDGFGRTVADCAVALPGALAATRLEQVLRLAPNLGAWCRPDGAAAATDLRRGKTRLLLALVNQHKIPTSPDAWRSALRVVINASPAASGNCTWREARLLLIAVVGLHDRPNGRDLAHCSEVKVLTDMLLAALLGSVTPLGGDPWPSMTEDNRTACADVMCTAVAAGAKDLAMVIMRAVPQSVAEPSSAFDGRNAFVVALDRRADDVARTFMDHAPHDVGVKLRSLISQVGRPQEFKCSAAAAVLRRALAEPSLDAARSFSLSWLDVSIDANEPRQEEDDGALHLSFEVALWCFEAEIGGTNGDFNIWGLLPLITGRSVVLPAPTTSSLAQRTTLRVLVERSLAVLRRVASAPKWLGPLMSWYVASAIDQSVSLWHRLCGIGVGPCGALRFIVGVTEPTKNQAQSVAEGTHDPWSVIDMMPQTRCDADAYSEYLKLQQLGWLPDTIARVRRVVMAAPTAKEVITVIDSALDRIASFNDAATADATISPAALVTRSLATFAWQRLAASLATGLLDDSMLLYEWLVSRLGHWAAVGPDGSDVDQAFIERRRSASGSDNFTYVVRGTKCAGGCDALLSCLLRHRQAIGIHTGSPAGAAALAAFAALDSTVPVEICVRLFQSLMKADAAAPPESAAESHVAPAVVAAASLLTSQTQEERGRQLLRATVDGRASWSLLGGTRNLAVALAVRLAEGAVSGAAASGWSPSLLPQVERRDKIIVNNGALSASSEFLLRFAQECVVPAEDQQTPEPLTSWPHRGGQPAPPEELQCLTIDIALPLLAVRSARRLMVARCGEARESVVLTLAPASNLWLAALQRLVRQTAPSACPVSWQWRQFYAAHALECRDAALHVLTLQPQVRAREKSFASRCAAGFAISREALEQFQSVIVRLVKSSDASFTTAIPAVLLHYCRRDEATSSATSMAAAIVAALPPAGRNRTATQMMNEAITAVLGRSREDSHPAADEDASIVALYETLSPYMDAPAARVQVMLRLAAFARPDRTNRLLNTLARDHGAQLDPQAAARIAARLCRRAPSNGFTDLAIGLLSVCSGGGQKGGAEAVAHVLSIAVAVGDVSMAERIESTFGTAAGAAFTAAELREATAQLSCVLGSWPSFITAAALPPSAARSATPCAVVEALLAANASDGDAPDPDTEWAVDFQPRWPMKLCGLPVAEQAHMLLRSIQTQARAWESLSPDRPPSTSSAAWPHGDALLRVAVVQDATEGHLNEPGSASAALVALVATPAFGNVRSAAVVMDAAASIVSQHGNSAPAKVEAFATWVASWAVRDEAATAVATAAAKNARPLDAMTAMLLRSGWPAGTLTAASSHALSVLKEHATAVGARLTQAAFDDCSHLRAITMEDRLTTTPFVGGSMRRCFALDAIHGAAAERYWMEPPTSSDLATHFFGDLSNGALGYDIRGSLGSGAVSRKDLMSMALPPAIDELLWRGAMDKGTRKKHKKDLSVVIDFAVMVARDGSDAANARCSFDASSSSLRIELCVPLDHQQGAAPVVSCNGHDGTDGLLEWLQGRLRAA